MSMEDYLHYPHVRVYFSRMTLNDVGFVDQLLASIDMALGNESQGGSVAPDSYTTVGIGSQILKDLGVGKIHLMGAPMKYNAISGFDLEVLDFVDPGA